MSHAKHGTRVYKTWINVKQRCHNPNSPDYEFYGGRGIRVCERWADFENFLADLGEPEPGMTLDRIDVDGDYEPRNCRWVDRKTQARNRRDNRVVEFQGEMRLLIELAEEYGINNETLRTRVIQYGWTIEKSLLTPVRGRRRAS